MEMAKPSSSEGVFPGQIFFQLMLYRSGSSIKSHHLGSRWKNPLPPKVVIKNFDQIG